VRARRGLADVPVGSGVEADVCSGSKGYKRCWSGRLCLWGGRSIRQILWRKHHLDYDQTIYVVERVRRRLALEPPGTRSRTVARLNLSEIERLIQTTYH
jgi:hypothetical protein